MKAIKVELLLMFKMQTNVYVWWDQVACINSSGQISIALPNIDKYLMKFLYSIHDSLNIYHRFTNMLIHKRIKRLKKNKQKCFLLLLLKRLCPNRLLFFIETLPKKTSFLYRERLLFFSLRVLQKDYSLIWFVWWMRFIRKAYR